MTTLSNNKKPWWTGVPTKLIRKIQLVPENDGHLPVHTLTFEIPRIGQYEFSGRAQPLENVRIDMGEVVKMVIPGYKPKSYSMSALRLSENEFDITLEIYPNGRASGYLDRIPLGGTINSFGIRNSSRVRNPGKFFGAIAYGVGITEILPVARAELEKGDAAKVVILWASRTMADTFWHEQILELKQRYGDRFEIIYILSREKSTTTALHGRINPSILKEIFESRLNNAAIDDDNPASNAIIPRDEARFLVIGTKTMMRQTESMFTEIGFPWTKHALFV